MSGSPKVTEVRLSKEYRFMYENFVLNRDWSSIPQHPFRPPSVLALDWHWNHATTA